MQNLITGAGIARELGISRQRISVLINNGTLAAALVSVKGKKRKMLDKNRALQIMRASLDPAQRRNGEDNSEYHQAKAAELRIKIEKMQFELKVRRGEFVKKKDAERKLALMLAAGRSSFENATVQLSHELSTETDRHKIFVISSKILNTAFYHMRAAATITEAAMEGISESEIKKALEKVDNAPVGKVAAAKLYSEILRAVSQGLSICEGLDVKKPGRYDSCFLHDDIVLDCYSLFARLRRSLLDPAIEIRDIIPVFEVELKALRNEIDKRICGEGAEIGAEYKGLLKSGAKDLK